MVIPIVGIVLVGMWNEMKKNCAEAIHLATGLVVGYPPCPRIRHFKEYIETHYEIPIVIGTHPIPLKYMEIHKKLSFWEKMNMEALAGHLMQEDEKIMETYN